MVLKFNDMTDMESVNLDKIDKMVLLVFKNSLRLHLDSIVLYNNRAYPSAFFLSVIALEELGKVSIFDHFLDDSRFHGRLNETTDPDISDLQRYFGSKNLEEGFFNRHIRSHRRKQLEFLSAFDSKYKPSNEYFKNIRDGTIEKKKQDSLYVGLRKLKGRIINPTIVSRRNVSNQIGLVHTSLLELILNVSKQNGTVASDHLVDYLTEALYFKVKSKWRITQRRRKQRLEKMEKWQ